MNRDLPSAGWKWRWGGQDGQDLTPGEHKDFICCTWLGLVMLAGSEILRKEEKKRERKEGRKKRSQEINSFIWTKWQTLE